MPDNLSNIKNAIQSGDYRLASQLIGCHLLRGGPVEAELIEALEVIKENQAGSDDRKLIFNSDDYDFDTIGSDDIEYINKQYNDPLPLLLESASHGSLRVDCSEIEVRKSESTGELYCGARTDHDSYTSAVTVDHPYSDEEFDWDLLEQSDEILENDFPSPTAFADDDLLDGRVSDDWRARQNAFELIRKYDWSPNSEELLVRLLSGKGWASTLVALEYELLRGMTFDELTLADFLRVTWESSDHFWISFFEVKSINPDYRASPTFHRLGWRQSLRIIRGFGALPDEDDLLQFLDEAYDDWYCSEHKRARYKAFIVYLKYRTESLPKFIIRQEVEDTYSIVHDEMWGGDELSSHEIVWDDLPLSFLERG